MMRAEELHISLDIFHGKAGFSIFDDSGGKKIHGGILNDMIYDGFLGFLLVKGDGYRFVFCCVVCCCAVWILHIWQGILAFKTLLFALDLDCVVGWEEGRNGWIGFEMR